MRALTVGLCLFRAGDFEIGVLNIQTEAVDSTAGENFGSISSMHPCAISSSCTTSGTMRRTTWYWIG